MITVLFVDDEPALLDVSRLYMEKTGDLKVEPCFSAEQAMEMLKARAYDVIVSDYEMPGIDGIEFLKILRNLGDFTPFIIFTGKGREHVVIEALNCGADFYLQKGGDPRSQFAELIHKIRLAVQRRKDEQSLQITRYSVEKASIQIYWLDTSGRYIYANEAACSALGYRIEELLLLTIGDVDTSISREEWGRFVDRLRNHGSIVLESLHLTKDRRLVPVEVACTYSEFQGRGIIFAYARRHREPAGTVNAPAGVRGRCRARSGGSPRMFFEVTDSGEIVFCNQAAADRIRDRENPGNFLPTILTLFPVENRPLVSGILDRVVREGPPEILSIPFSQRGDPPLEISFQASYLPPAAGVPHVMLREMETSEGMGSFQESAGLAPLGLMLLSDTIQGCNPEACRLVGHHRPDLVGSTLLDLSPPYQPDGRESSLTLLERFYSAGTIQACTFPWVFRSESGELRPLFITATPIEHLGRKMFLVALTRPRLDR